MIYGVEMVNLTCNLTPSIVVIPPNGKGTITLLITNAVNGVDSIINLGGDTYSLQEHQHYFASTEILTYQTTK